jgi:putative transposase
LRSPAALGGGEREFWIVGLLPSAIITRMSRLRRLVLSDRWFFITCRVLPRRRHLSDSEFATWAEVIAERRAEHRFLLTAWVFLPDHWHAIFYPRHPLTISRVMEAIKDGATKRVNHSRRETGTLWQPRFFDRALRTMEEYNAKVEYIHWNPVRAGLVSRPEEWPWKSVHDYTGSVQRPVGRHAERAGGGSRVVARR